MSFKTVRMTAPRGRLHLHLAPTAGRQRRGRRDSSVETNPPPTLRPSRRITYKRDPVPPFCELSVVSISWRSSPASAAISERQLYWPAMSFKSSLVCGRILSLVRTFPDGNGFPSSGHLIRIAQQPRDQRRNMSQGFAVAEDPQEAPAEARQNLFPAREPPAESDTVYEVPRLHVGTQLQVAPLPVETKGRRKNKYSSELGSKS